MKQLIITLLLLAGYALQVSAQDKINPNQVTKEQINKLNEIVKPVKETIDKILAEDQKALMNSTKKKLIC